MTTSAALKIAEWAFPMKDARPWSKGVILVDNQWTFKPEHCLNDCALVEAVIEERGLAERYWVSLYNEVHGVSNGLDLHPLELAGTMWVYDLALAPAPTRTRAIVALIDGETNV